MTIRRLIVVSVLLVAAAAAQAGENVALIIANKDYKNFIDSRAAYTATQLNTELEAAGFQVRTIRNMSRKAIAQLAPVIRSEIKGADRVLVFMGGHVFSTGRDSFLMATDALKSDPFRIGANGLPISMIVDLLGEKAGAAVLLIGDSGYSVRLDDELSYGYVPNGIAQGVTVYAGRMGALAALVKDGLLVPGTSTLDAAERAPTGVTAYGFLSRAVPFLPMPPATDSSDAKPIDELEQLIWDNANAARSIAAVQSYLDRYPDGHFAVDANALLAQIARTPEEQARDAEHALDLSRDARRDIQRNLSLLDFDTRGIDGIFGPGSRKAVAAWQNAKGLDVNGYLTGRQISTLEAEAAVRAAELEEEARLRRQEQERQDAQFWRDTGRNGDEAGLRAYTKKYPDGLYSSIAAERLAVFDEERRRTVAIAEGNAWDVAQETGTAAGYRAFLKEYPEGVFSESAAEKLAAMEPAAGADAAIAEERRVLNNPITRILVEQKLASLGFKPGKIDGKVDKATRKAVRQFQRAATLPVTGYVSQAMIVRLLAAN